MGSKFFVSRCSAFLESLRPNRIVAAKLKLERAKVVSVENS